MKAGGGLKVCTEVINTLNQRGSEHLERMGVGGQMVSRNGKINEENSDEVLISGGNFRPMNSGDNRKL